MSHEWKTAMVEGPVTEAQKAKERLWEFKARLTSRGAEVLAQRAYESVMCDLPLVTPRWDEADPKIRAAFIARYRGDLTHFVIPAIEDDA
jgi:hypothetical protein